jgi:hypothetical protein
VVTEPPLAARLGAGAQASVRERFDYRVLLPAISDALAGAALIPARDPTRLPFGRAEPALEVA